MFSYIKRQYVSAPRKSQKWNFSDIVIKDRKVINLNDMNASFLLQACYIDKVNIWKVPYIHIYLWNKILTIKTKDLWRLKEVKVNLDEYEVFRYARL